MQTHRSGFFCTFVLLTFQKGKEMKKIAIVGFGFHEHQRLIHQIQMYHEIIVVDLPIDEMEILKECDATTIEQMTFKEVKRDEYFQQPKIHPKHQKNNRFNIKHK